LLITSRFVGSFDEFAVLEPRASADQGDQVGCVDRAPAGLGGLDEFEGHRHAGGAGAGSLGDPLAESDGREGLLDRVGRPEVGSVLGGVVVERQQLVQVVGDLGDGLAELGSVGGLELLDGVEGVLLVGHSSNATCSPVVDDEQ